MVRKWCSVVGIDPLSWVRRFGQAGCSNAYWGTRRTCTGGRRSWRITSPGFNLPRATWRPTPAACDAQLRTARSVGPQW